MSYSQFREILLNKQVFTSDESIDEMRLGLGLWSSFDHFRFGGGSTWLAEEEKKEHNHGAGQTRASCAKPALTTAFDATAD
jgi:hypothetical protein